MDRVVSWFGEYGFAVLKEGLIDRTLIFDDREAAKDELAAHFGIDRSMIPETFSGTVDGKTLFLVSRTIYEENYTRLYPDLPWSEEEYGRLMAHELVHRAHSLIALERFGTEDGMGPRWFFEGLAIALAGQFAPPGGKEEPLSWKEIADHAARDREKILWYPVYGRMFRSLATSFPVDTMIAHAYDDDFLDRLSQDYIPSEFVLERPDRPVPRGSILLIHGSAPFDLDGRIPMEGLDTPYARDHFYRDLARAFRGAGWKVLRHSKPGVSRGGIDKALYAETDLALLGRQLRNLWRFLPGGGPRIVFAWSEGSLHVRMLPLDEIDGVILLGGIATNIADVIAWQGGPSKEEFVQRLAGMGRHEMIGLDRPVGRLADELALPDNWKTFEAQEDLPILVLHGEADGEVPAGQAVIWAERLPESDLTVAIEAGFDHRFMPEGVYDPIPLADRILAWLDRTFPAP